MEPPHSSSGREPFVPNTTAFNARKKSAPIHPCEKALIVAAAVQLCFLPWALGAMNLPSQLASLVLSALAFAIALIPRRHTEEFSRDGRPSSHSSIRRLIAFPGFWLGAFTLGYALIQALNPAWTYKEGTGGEWWMEPIAYTAWLPTGASTPFEDWSSWRSLIVWSSAWLLVCSLWIGVTRRASIRALLVILAVNGAILALLGVLQKVAGNGKILWFITPSTYYPVSTFLYKNHAGAFFHLLLTVCAGMAFWYHGRAERRLERTSPSPVFAVGCVLFALVITLSHSRTALLLMACVLALCLVIGAIRWLRSPQRPRLAVVALPVILLGVALTFSAQYLHLDEAATHLKELFTTDRFISINQRLIAAQATWEMASAKLATGWGAGDFKFLFPLFQQNHPAIYIPSWAPSGMYSYEHAHNDYLEFLAELGVIGCAPLVALIGLWLAKLVRSRVWKNGPLALVTLGILVLLAHCWVDFPLQNPAILLTACALGALTGRWADLEPRKRAGN